MAAAPKLKRKKKTNPCPNPLFVQWLTEWRDEAAEKGIKTQYAYGKALGALKKYPLPLPNGKAAKILDNFGDKICGMLDKKLQAHYATSGDSSPPPSLPCLPDDPAMGRKVGRPSTTTQPSTSGISTEHYCGVPSSKEDKAPKRNTTATKRAREYVPLYRSGPYSLILALYQNHRRPGSKGYMIKTELQEAAQPLCEKSMTLPDPGSHYTAWSSMSTLITKGYIVKEGSPARYIITESGCELAHKLEAMNGQLPRQEPITSSLRPAEDDDNDCVQVEESRPMRVDINFHGGDNIVEDEIVDGWDEDGIALKDKPAALFTLTPGNFDVILCVDNCETTGIAARNSKGRKHVLLKELQKNGVNLDVRKLQVGDFLWVAREKGGGAPALPGVLQAPARREVVLDFVVERKRMDDLCSSIQDGRFKEQKFRLKQCGLGHPIYLVEEFGSADHMSLPASTLFQSTVNTQVIDGFSVKHTRDTKESAAYLTIMTRYIHSLYAGKTLKAHRREDIDQFGSRQDLQAPQQHCLTFPEFNDSSVKNKETTVTETFAKHLLQFSGMTAEKALALTQIYPTPQCLMAAYTSCHVPSDQEKMLAKIKYGHSQRNIGPALSKVVYQLYRTRTALR